MTTLTLEASLAYLDAECARRSLRDFATLMSLPSYEQGDLAAAITDYTSIVERYSSNADPEMRAVVATAREQLAKLAD